MKKTTILSAATAMVLLLGSGSTKAQLPSSLNNSSGRLRSGGANGAHETESRSLRASLATDRSQYGTGRAVEITITLTSLSRDQRVSVDLQGRSPYDITVRNVRTGRSVWTGPSLRNGSARRISLEPGRSRVSRELWDQTGTNGRRVDPGVYRVEARVQPFGTTISAPIYLSDRDDRRDTGSGRGGLNNDLPPRPGESPGRNDDDDRNEADLSSLQAELRADRTSVRVGETITLRYTVTNRSRRAQTLRFSSGQRFEIEARRDPEPNARYREGALTVWRLSQDQMSTQALGQLSLGPGERRTFTASWRPESRQVRDGSDYTLAAFLTTSGARRGVAEAFVRVRVSGGGGRNDEERPGLPGRLR